MRLTTACGCRIRQIWGGNESSVVGDRNWGIINAFLFEWRKSDQMGFEEHHAWAALFALGVESDKRSPRVRGTGVLVSTPISRYHTKTILTRLQRVERWGLVLERWSFCPGEVSGQDVCMMSMEILG
jgi:hypothetical protein